MSKMEKAINQAIARLTGGGAGQFIKIKYKPNPKKAKAERLRLFRAQKAYWKKSGRS
jgi:hypothetical protein